MGMLVIEDPGTCGAGHNHSYLEVTCIPEPFQEFLRNQILIFSQVVWLEYFQFMCAHHTIDKPPVLFIWPYSRGWFCVCIGCVWMVSVRVWMVSVCV